MSPPTIKLGGAVSSDASRAQRKDVKTQTRAGEGDVISRQQNLTPERRRGERGKENKETKAKGWWVGRREKDPERSKGARSRVRARRRRVDDAAPKTKPE